MFFGAGEGGAGDLGPHVGGMGARRVSRGYGPDTAADETNHVSGPEFKRFVADFLRRQGYAVEETSLSGD
jgi:hypothetical protein